MKTILVATDFSEGSVNAANQAVRIAAQADLPLLFFHSLTPPIVDVNLPAEMVDEIYKASSSAAEEKLKEITAEAAGQGVSASYLLSYSDLPSGIGETIEEKEVGMVIIARSAHPDFFKRLFGSTAEYLIHKFTVPLLIIPEEAQKDVFSHILYATRLEFDEINIISQVIELKKTFGSKMTLAKVDEYMELNVHEDQGFIDDIRTHFPEESFEIIQEKGHTFVTVIQDIASKIEASVLTVASSKRNLLEALVDPSKSKKLVGESPLPVLVYNF